VRRYKIRAIIPKWIIWLALLFNLLIFIIGVLWLIIKLNIPWVNSGDINIVRIIIVMWWAITSLVIFGWKVDYNQ